MACRSVGSRIPRTPPQRGDPQRDHGKPVEEIFTEAPFGDLIAQISVGGGDEAEPGYDFGGAAHTHEPLVLEYA